MLLALKEFNDCYKKAHHKKSTCPFKRADIAIPSLIVKRRHSREVGLCPRGLTMDVVGFWFNDLDERRVYRTLREKKRRVGEVGGRKRKFCAIAKTLSN
jgi:hypothetical protein